jgi:hypothetical protein
MQSSKTTRKRTKIQIRRKNIILKQTDAITQIFLYRERQTEHEEKIVKRWRGEGVVKQETVQRHEARKRGETGKKGLKAEA